MKLYQFVLKISSERENLTSIKGHNSVTTLRKIAGSNPNLDIVNINAHTKFGQILSIRSQDIGWKRHSDINHGHHNICSKCAKTMCNNPNLDLASINGNEILIFIMNIMTSVSNVRKMCSNPNLDLVSINAYAKFGKIIPICSQNIEQKQNYKGQNDRQMNEKMGRRKNDGLSKSSLPPVFQSEAIITSMTK